MRLHAFLTAAVVLAGSGPALAASSPPRASEAVLLKADGTEAGRAKLVDRKDGVHVTVDVSGVQPGTHGLHLHTTGQCTPPDFASAGGHWNPTQRAHGHEAPQGAHLGDLPNIEVGPDGRGSAQALISGATLKPGALSVHDADGTAIVLHAGPDDYVSDPAGNSGARVACGVVETR